MLSHLSQGFLLGIATGTSCLATCGPIYMPYLMQYERSLLRSFFALMEISAGRFVTYLLIGLLAGLVGRSIPLDYKEWFTAIAYISFSLFLVLAAFRTQRREQCCKPGKWYAFVDRPLVLGLLTGINFCPSFLLALTKAVDLSGPLAGMIFFAAFFAGTSLFLLPLSLFGLFGRQRLFRTIARVIAVVIGIWFIVQSILTIRQIISEHSEARIDARNVINIMDTLPAYIMTSDTVAVHLLKNVLAQNRKGPVAVVNDTARIAGHCYIFVHADTQDVHSHPLRKAGRFIVVLPDTIFFTHDAPAVRKLVSFLHEFSFKIDPDSGSVYEIPAGVFK